jgi:hypothetical protein
VDLPRGLAQILSSGNPERIAVALAGVDRRERAGFLYLNGRLPDFPAQNRPSLVVIGAPLFQPDVLRLSDRILDRNQDGDFATYSALAC